MVVWDSGEKTGGDLSVSKVVDLVVLTLFLFLPEGQVLLKELDDALGVTEVVLLELVDLVEGISEGVVSKLASLLVVLHDFVVEDGEVEGKSELDWVAWWEGDLVSLLVSCQSFLLHLFELIILGVLGDVAIVVSNHLDEESLWLSITGLAEDLYFNHIDDSFTIFSKFFLDSSLVIGQSV